MKHIKLYEQFNSDLDTCGEEIWELDHNKNILKYMQYIKEFSDPLSGTTDIKIKVENKNYLIDKLIEDLSIIVKKRKLKAIRIKSIEGYINKNTITHRGSIYNTYLQIIFTNKDTIIGEYNSSSNNILIKINDNIVFDLNYRTFDNEILIGKIINEYMKYLKENKFKINENYETII